MSRDEDGEDEDEKDEKVHYVALSRRAHQKETNCHIESTTG